ncbi:TnsA endonuclease N-terminal domain-containing protein [Noviherbaspirillum sp. 1P10PC]|uniref:TnsA endonuclease N-terminal domain-containing protein n=1 Tax=Noviherbaspirillum sp. 1P10PC TaxID=3132292 RepID=UPI0039A0D52A
MEWSRDLKMYPRYWHNRLKRGFGLGAGVAYHPWLRVRDVPSIGTSGNPKGIKVSRIYHLLSTPERVFFHLLDRQPNVIDIREQFPILHLNETQSICSELGIRHTRRGPYPEPFTLDFFVTRQTPLGVVFQARSIKTPEHAADPNVRLRLAVEHIWCQAHGIDWKLIDTSGFTGNLLSTLTFMRGWSVQRYIPNPEQADEFAKVFHNIYTKNLPLREIVELCSKRLKRGYGHCLNEFRYCAWSNRIVVDLTAKLTLHLPVVLRNGRF